MTNFVDAKPTDFIYSEHSETKNTENIRLSGMNVFIRQNDCFEKDSVLSTNGQCNKCGDYSRAPGSVECRPDICEVRYKLLRSGKCEHCPDHER